MNFISNIKLKTTYNMNGGIALLFRSQMQLTDSVANSVILSIFC